ncbi:ATP-dependent Lon protease [Thermotomaculum hydrothermale]|uniref:endopeptidase La n=1 Tax=Thermotomaculum hydrothermale TaxID=981385 RepID=A0A7R6PMS6_9BACT|nr:ATP-binding protein [Thermotomaculum hydrothermale]BBB31971.1 ATP-dependent Lon protease [Thermotomaculum hydrothermale]
MEKLTPKNLKWTISSKKLNFNTTDDITPTREIIGQPKAMKALEFGLSMDAPGYNIFVTGLSGTGKMTTIKTFLDKFATGKKTPQDLCYVQNFKNKLQPKLIKLQPGKGKKFVSEMEKFKKELATTLPKIFESNEYKEGSKKIVSKCNELENKLLLEFEKETAKKGFKVVKIEGGVKADVYPVINNKVYPIDSVRNLVAEGKLKEKDLQKILKVREELIDKLQYIYSKIEENQEKLHAELLKFNKQAVIPTVEKFLLKVIEKVGKEIEEYTKDILNYFENNFYQLLDSIMDEEKENLSLKLEDFSVNLIVDNGNLNGAPIVTEISPSKQNLFGTIDSHLSFGKEQVVNFMDIRPGSILKANGGYLVLNANDIFQEGVDVWVKLKRTLKNSLLEIEKAEQTFLHTVSLKPEPVPISLKVIILGDEKIYYTLYKMDDEFKKIFKVLSEFSPVIDINDKNLEDYLRVLKKIIDEEKLLPFSKKAILQILNESVRLSGDREKFTARFHLIADIMREASFVARSKDSQIVNEKHVEEAVFNKIHRYNLFEEEILEEINNGFIMVDTEGEKVGVINGLSVYDYEFHSFGKPTRITAQVALGDNGIVNIEREAELSGSIHDKGVLILQGYLQGKYGKDFPLSINASITFEQSYGGVDGDSASSTELYVLLSAIGDIPLKQNIAVTGSINQHGEIQPVGGINQKIEGFFKVCRERGLTGDQGVIIPYQNVRNLNLCPTVINAVKKGKFHIYAIKTVDEGIEILTGLKAGDINNPDSVHGIVYNKLKNFAEKMKNYN